MYILAFACGFMKVRSSMVGFREKNTSIILIVNLRFSQSSQFATTNLREATGLTPPNPNKQDSDHEVQ